MGYFISTMTRGSSSPYLLYRDIVLGVMGTLIGGLTMNLVGLSRGTTFNSISLIVAIVASSLLIFGGRKLYRAR